jgi:hypothetical protein
MKTSQPTNRLSFNNWARYITAEANRATYGKRPKSMNKSNSL